MCAVDKVAGGHHFFVGGLDADEFDMTLATRNDETKLVGVDDFTRVAIAVAVNRLGKANLELLAPKCAIRRRVWVVATNEVDDLVIRQVEVDFAVFD